MKSSEIPLHRFESPRQLHEALAERVAQDLNRAIESKGRASLMLSGGNTPRPFLRRLVRQDVDWRAVDIGLVDERWVPPVAAESNEALVRNEMLDNGAEGAAFYGMYREGMTPENAAADVEETLHRFLYPFDIVVLGMGTDGHTASLFPHRPELKTLMETTALCGVSEAPAAPRTRLTLTLHAIASCARCYLHIEGSRKFRVYETALEGGDADAMPVRAVLRHPAIAIETYFAQEET